MVQARGIRQAEFPSAGDGFSIAESEERTAWQFLKKS